MAAPTIVQNVAVSGNACFAAATFGAAPTNGNLILAIVTYQGGTGTPSTDDAPDTGWALAGITTTASYTVRETIAVYYKYAGAGESTSQRCSLGTSRNGVASYYEVAGAGLTIGAAVDNSAAVTTAAVTSQSVSAISSSGTSDLVIIGYGGRKSSGGVGATISGASFAQDQTISNTFARGGAGHLTSTSGSTGSPTIAWPATGTDGVQYAMVMLHSGSSTETGTVDSTYAGLSSQLLNVNTGHAAVDMTFAGLSPQALTVLVPNKAVVDQNFAGLGPQAVTVTMTHPAVLATLNMTFRGFAQSVNLVDVTPLPKLRQFWTFG